MTSWRAQRGNPRSSFNSYQRIPDGGYRPKWHINQNSLCCPITCRAPKPASAQHRHRLGPLIFATIDAQVAIKNIPRRQHHRSGNTDWLHADKSAPVACRQICQSVAIHWSKPLALSCSEWLPVFSTSGGHSSYSRSNGRLDHWRSPVQVW